MYIPENRLSTLEDMYNFLRRGIEDGSLFKTVYYVDSNGDVTQSASDAVAIQCTDSDDHIILEVSASVNGDSQFGFFPYVNGTKITTVPHFTPIWKSNSYSMQCTGGMMFLSTYSSSSDPKQAASTDSNYYFIIGKTKSGKTAFASTKYASGFGVPMNLPYYIYGSHDYAWSSYPIYPTSYSDNTELAAYSTGYPITALQPAVSDRTIFSYIPIIGARGSTDYFDTVFARTRAQYLEDGIQIVDDKYYGILGLFAILDD